jgi:hypothetical protein
LIGSESFGHDTPQTMSSLLQKRRGTIWSSPALQFQQRLGLPRVHTGKDENPSLLAKHQSLENLCPRSLPQPVR